MAKDKAVKWILLSAGVVVLWFLGVDKLSFIEDCGGCMKMEDVVQYRVFTFVVGERRSDYGPNLLKTIAEDLGVPCAHETLNQSNKMHYCGLCIPMVAGEHGMIKMGGDVSWYDAVMASKVKAMAAEDARVGEEFHRRIIVEHDWAYWKEFVQKLRGEEAAGIND